MTKRQTREILRPLIPRILALLGAWALIATAALFSWRFSPGREAAWFGHHYLLLAGIACIVAFPASLGMFCARRLPTFCVVLVGALGAGAIHFTALSLDFREEVAQLKGAEGRRALLLIDDSDDVGAALIFRVEHADGTLAAEETIPGPLFFDSADLKRWALRLREHGGQLQVLTSGGQLLAWHTPATGRISTRTFDPEVRH